jgi:hypothetical protein
MLPDLAGKLSILRLQSFDDDVGSTRKISGSDDNDYGILCRYMDENNFYFFEICGRILWDWQI